MEVRLAKTLQTSWILLETIAVRAKVIIIGQFK